MVSIFLGKNASIANFADHRQAINSRTEEKMDITDVTWGFLVYRLATICDEMITKKVGEMNSIKEAERYRELINVISKTS